MKPNKKIKKFIQPTVELFEQQILYIEDNFLNYQNVQVKNQKPDEDAERGVWIIDLASEKNT